MKKSDNTSGAEGDNILVAIFPISRNSRVDRLCVIFFAFYIILNLIHLYSIKVKIS